MGQGTQLLSLPACQETMPLVCAILSDTPTARAGKIMQTPSDFWKGWVSGETGSVWGKPEKTNRCSVNHSHHCLLPHWEAVPDSGAVNASALFLDPVSVPACIFSCINYPSVWPRSLWYRKWSRAQIFLTKRTNSTPTIFKVLVPNDLDCSGPYKYLQRETTNPPPRRFLPALNKCTSVTPSLHHKAESQPLSLVPLCSRKETGISVQKLSPLSTLPMKSHLFHVAQLEKKLKHFRNRNI